MTFDYSVITDNLDVFARGYLQTLTLLVLVIPISFVGGTAIALARISGKRWLMVPARAFVELVRNIPFLIQIFLVFYGLPFYGIDLGAKTAGVLCLSLYGSAYLSESVRGAIEAVPRGQWEASDALALSYTQKMRWIIAPQLPAYLIPAAGNILITLSKETALLSIITVPELTYMAQSVIGKSFAPVEVFTLLAIMYWFTSEAISQVMKALERHFAKKALPPASQQSEDILS